MSPILKLKIYLTFYRDSNLFILIINYDKKSNVALKIINNL